MTKREFLEDLRKYLSENFQKVQLTAMLLIIEIILKMK